MSVITMSKPKDDVVSALARRAELEVVVLGCDKCAKVSKTGGSEEVRSIRLELSRAGIPVRNVAGLVDAVEEGLCDAKAVSERLQRLLPGDGAFQVLVLSCGAGLKCVRDVLPGVRLVPGLDTLGPGVKGDLACLACGDCRFGDEGCKMLSLAGEHAARLKASYGAAAQTAGPITG